MKKTIGIIGAGAIGKTLAKHFAQAGHEVWLSNSRSPESLADAVQELGENVKATTSLEAANADLVVLSVPWQKLEAAVQAIPNWQGKIVIDANNHMLAATRQLVDLGGKTSSEVVAALLPGARVVKAFNTLYYKVLEQAPREPNGSRVLFLSGDDVAAKQAVRDLMAEVGFAPVDLGSLVDGGRLQQIGGSLATLNLLKKA